MSGSVTRSGQLPALQEAVNAFTSKVAQYQETAVYAFDGMSRGLMARSGGNEGDYTAPVTPYSAPPAAR